MVTTDLVHRLAAILVADAAGYSRLMAADERATLSALDAARAVFRKEIESRQGRVIDMAGDSVLAVFHLATSAVSAALAIQDELDAVAEELPESRRLRFRVGVHIGEVMEKPDGTVYGDGVNIAARLASLADPGCTVVSDAVRGSVKSRVGATFEDLGEQELKNIAERVRAFRAVANSGAQDGGAIVASASSVTAGRPSLRTHIPSEPTPFVGRVAEVAAVVSLLRNPSVRLVTLVGIGGVGKTRLAMRIASDLKPDFPGGVRFLGLAAVPEAALLPQAIAIALDLRNIGPDSIADRLEEALRGPPVLLVLDNLEHLVAGAPALARLLESAANLKILATSRQPLRLLAEHEYVVSPFAVPGRRATSAELEACDAVRMFEGRAAAVQHEFQAKRPDVRTIAEVCRKLDGIPLAIELAAARLRVLSPQTLLTRLEHRLETLIGGARDAPDRQRTLRAAIDWSYSLLAEDEQQLFARLGIFANGLTLGAAEAVCGPDADARLLEEVDSLVDKNLLRVQTVDGEPRFSMLETIREYAREQLDRAGKSEEVGEFHACYYLGLCSRARDGFRGPKQAQWVKTLYLEKDNIRAALRWFTDRSRIDELAEITWSLWLPAWMGGTLDEALQVVGDALATGAPTTRRHRARLLAELGMFSVWKGQVREAIPALQEALRLAREEQDEEIASYTLVVLGLVAATVASVPEARKLVSESLQLAEKAGDAWVTAAALAVLGWLRVALEEHEDNDAVFTDTLRAARAVGDSLVLGIAEDNLAEHYLHLGRYEDAAGLLTSALERFSSLHAYNVAMYAIDGAARFAAYRHDARTAATLLGATEALREQLAAPIWSSANARHDRLVAVARGALEPQIFARCWSDGRAMRFGEAIAVALACLRPEEAADGAPS